MSRLGFGNMYVHIATFLLLCLAPFFIFDLAGGRHQHRQRGRQGRAGPRRHLPLRPRPPLRRLLEDPDAPEVPSAGEPRLLRQAGPHRLPALALLLPVRSGSGSPHGRHSASSSCKTSSINQRS